MDRNEISERLTEVFLLPKELSNKFVVAIQMALHDWSKRSWTEQEQETIVKFLAYIHQDMEEQSTS